MSQFNGSLEAVKVQYENKVCTITMARPEKNNGLDLQMRKELWAIFAALKEDNETQVVVLTGQGTHFSYGTFDPASRGATRSEEHTSELQSLMRISYAVFCLKKKTIKAYTKLYPVDITNT